jgi:hypothetical protein
MKTYPLDVWESVLKEVGFTFIDETVGWQDTSNCLLYRDSTNIEAKIWFNRKTEVITTISLVLRSPNHIKPYSESIPVDLFIKSYSDKFRHYLIEKFVN